MPHHPTWSEEKTLFMAAINGAVPIDATCASCKWWEANEPTGCHRHCPAPTGWPATTEHDFCGDWESGYIPTPRS
jgi:hypothetical protein